MKFNTIINTEGKFVAPCYRPGTRQEKHEMDVVDTPVLLDLYYDTVEKVRDNFWKEYELNWSGIKVVTLTVQII